MDIKIKPNPNCIHCKQRLITLVKIMETEKGEIQRTKTELDVCANSRCWSFINVEEVKTWKVQNI